jgi:integrating conjugative element protein (TIGR03761 family)
VTEPPTDVSLVSARAPDWQQRTPGVAERPGVLRGGATLTLQTRQAQRVVKGRGQMAGKPAIIGLIGFANMLRPIWHGSRADDPYADWWLLKIHDTLQFAQRQLVHAEHDIDAQFQAMGSIDVAAPASVKPARIALNFSNPYAFRGAQLVSVYDDLVRSVLSARHVGLLTRDESQRLLHVGGRQVRRALQSPVGYRFTGVTRVDVEQGTAKALQAKDVMGKLPDDVRTGERRAEHAPALAVPSTAAIAESIRLQPLPDRC